MDTSKGNLMIKIEKPGLLPESLIILCHECRGVVGEITPAIQLSYGFIANDEFNSYEHLLVHYDCLSRETLDKLIRSIEENE